MKIVFPPKFYKQNIKQCKLRQNVLVIKYNEKTKDIIRTFLDCLEWFQIKSYIGISHKTFLYFKNGIIAINWVILRYSRSMENGAPSSHIHGGVRSLNSWWGPPWMWEEGAPFHYTPGLPKNFPVVWFEITLHTRSLKMSLYLSEIYSIYLP